jgi:hypothetical protein
MVVKSRNRLKTTTRLLTCCLAVLFLAAPGPTPRRATSPLSSDDGKQSIVGVLSTDKSLTATKTKAFVPFVGVNA